MTDLRLPARPTLAGAVWPEQASFRARALRALALCVFGTAILVVAARTQVPFSPVPMTLQSLAVTLIGAAFGGRLAAATLSLYLLEGATGLPVFAGTPEHGLGLGYMTGPTGGFLVGFLLAGAAIGFFAERGADRSFAKFLPTVLLGYALIFACGFGWLAHLVGPGKAYAFGVEPFLGVSLVETCLAALVVPALWDRLPRPR